MTTAEIQQSNPSEKMLELQLKNELYPTFELKGKMDVYAVQFVGHTHPDVERAKQIERLTFTELGDNPDEIDKEFQSYDESSIFVLLRSCNTGSENDGRLLGMARFIPFHHQGNKTFNDLASLIESTDQEPLSRLLDENTEELYRSDVASGVIELFKEEYDCEDIEKVIDIATLAPDMTLDIKDKFDVIENLLKAMDVFVIDLYRRGQLTHLTQFTASPMHKILVSHYGYPMHEMFSLPPLVYDTFGNDKGGEENMIAIPSVIKLSELDMLFRESVLNPKTKHMAAIVTQLAVVFPAFSENAA